MCLHFVSLQAYNNNNLTNLMEQNPSRQDNTRSPGQDISAFYVSRAQKSSPLDSVLSQMNTAQTVTSYFYDIQFNIILPYMSTSSKQHKNLLFQLH